MTFIISFILGLFLGYKIKGALYIYKETRNVKFIKEVVNSIIGTAPIEIINSKEDFIREKVSKTSEKHNTKGNSSDDELEFKIAELKELFEERGY